MKSARKDLWGGRFREAPSPLLRVFNDSLGFDRELFAEDLEGSLAWARALRSAGALTASETAKIVRGLRRVSRAGAPDPGADFEDVHSFVEAQLGRAAGSIAGKLHTGRSRNDQVATDLRLYLKRAFDEARKSVLEIAETLARLAARDAATPMPGFTHARRAEPVTFGHWCLSFVEMLLRDAGRLADARDRADECPLGSGAISGSPVPVDRRALARGLGFSRPCANSIDAVSDRDAAADYLYCGSMVLSHLSRLAADLIFFSSDELGWVDLPDALSTGSSRMPHKKNPDVLELIRGHAGRSVGELAGLLAVFKGLTFAYNKDLQLDKEPVFRLRSVLATGLPALRALLDGIRLDRAEMRKAASSDEVLATELADALARRGVPFRKAHRLAGRRIAESLRLKKTLAALPVSGEVGAKDLRELDVDRALARRRAIGGTAPRRVARAAAEALARVRKAEGRR